MSSRKWPARSHDRPRRRTEPGTDSRSPSPDVELQRFLEQQARPASPESEAFRKQRIAAGGVSYIKSRRQREVEEAERRKKEEEEDAARAYREFVEDMQGGNSKGSIRDNLSKKRSAASFVRNDGSSYNPPQSGEARLAPRSDVPRNSARTHSSAFGEDEDAESRLVEDHASLQDIEVPGKRKGAMQDFLGELQRGQALREERMRSHGQDKGSVPSGVSHPMHNFGPRDDHDPHSSNVCVLNLPGNVSEHSMGVYFSRYGDVASVKIMWPRTEEEFFISLTSNGPAVRATRHEGATGFVNFMHRSDAQRAFGDIAGGLSWNGSLLHCGWGKSMSKSSTPLFVRSERPIQVHQDDSRAQLRRNEASRGRQHRKRRSSRSPALRNHRRRREVVDSQLELLRLQVRSESGQDAVELIETTVRGVKHYGPSYESMVREREAGNPLFSFLRDKESSEHRLYCALLDEAYVFPVVKKAFTDDGYASLYSSDSEEDSEWERLQDRDITHRSTELGAAAGRRLDAMLRGMTTRRERIAHVMLFAIEHASCADAVTDRLVESLLLSTTPLPRKLARLYAISDVLHNSSAPASSAWRFRSLLEAKLDGVFTHWGDIADSFAGRIKREACRDMARNVLDAWETWLVFDTERLAKWRSLVETGSGKSEAIAKSNREEGLERLATDTAVDERGFAKRDERPPEDGESEEDIDGEEM